MRIVENSGTDRCFGSDYLFDYSMMNFMFLVLKIEMIDSKRVAWVAEINENVL